MPDRGEITEEGFGYFRGTWYIGRATLAEASDVIVDEDAIIDWLDQVARDPAEFERLATAIENGDAETLEEAVMRVPMSSRVIEALSSDEELGVLGDLEIGIAGLTYALSALRCLTAASCRWHPGTQSWADCPVVFFAAPAWRVEILADLIAAGGCGLEAGRDMLSVYGRCIRDTHQLAVNLMVERRRFRKTPERSKSERRASRNAPPADRLPGFE